MDTDFPLKTTEKRIVNILFRLDAVPEGLWIRPNIDLESKNIFSIQEFFQAVEFLQIMTVFFIENLVTS